MQYSILTTIFKGIKINEKYEVTIISTIQVQINSLNKLNLVYYGQENLIEQAGLKTPVCIHWIIICIIKKSWKTLSIYNPTR